MLTNRQIARANGDKTYIGRDRKLHYTSSGNNISKRNIASAAWNKANPEKVTATAAAWRKANPERISSNNAARYKKNSERVIAASAAWAKTHPERKTAINAAWAKTHPERGAAHTAKRKAAKLYATPKWLTRTHFEHITIIYTLAAELTKNSGIQYEVDHIIPLLSKYVCGLHVPWNLQILPKSTNMRKSNKLIP